MIGAIIGAAAKVGAGIAGGIAASKAAKRNARILDAQKKRSQNWYDQEYNADFTQRSDAQAALGRARDILNEKYSQAQGAGVVAGATDESIALQKKAATGALADITSNIAERADAYKEQVRSNYVNEQNSIDSQQMQINNQRAQNVANAANQVAGAGSSLGNIMGK